MIRHSGLSLEETTNSLLQLDPILPIQFSNNFRRRTYLEPERVLMLVVLEDAVDCLQKYATCASGKKKRLFDQTMHWVLTDDDNWLFSFNSVCEAVGLSAGCLRKGLIRMADARSGKARKLQSRKLSSRRRKKGSIDRAAA